MVLNSCESQLPATIAWSRCGSLAFPAHRLDLGTVAPGPRGFPSPVDSSTLRCSLQPSCPSRLLQRHLPVCAVLSGSPSRALYRSTLRFPASPSRLPLLGLSKDAPPPSKLCESSPSCLLPKEPAAFGPTLPSARHLPSLSFFPTPTVYSSLSPAGLLHPATGHGVRVVSLHASHWLLCSSQQSSRPSPTRHSHPPEPFPRPQPHCVSAAVASSPSAWCLPPSACPPPK